MTNVNNLDTIVQGDPSSPDPPDGQTESPKSHWLRRWWWVIAILTTTSIIAAIVVTSLVVNVSYVIESPGNLYDTGSRIAIARSDGQPTYATDDKIDLVTVTLDTRVSVFDKFVADHFDDDAIVQPAKDVIGNQSPQQNDDLNALLMTQSKDTAVLAALHRLGYDVHPTPTGAIVRETATGSPADGKLRIAETIVAIDGQPVTSPDDVHNVLEPHKPGDHVTLTLEATDHTQRTVDITLGSNPGPERQGTAYIGVVLEPRLAYPDLPVTVTITSGGIGGPSAGLAFTLGILDLMTPGDLTGGKEVAVTGTIEADGKVGPIGGIDSKVLTVAHQHVKYFLVPVDDADEARAHAPADLQIVPVATLDDAVNFLLSIGGAGLPAASAASGT
jgi:PDZ domain-containing protein